MAEHCLSLDVNRLHREGCLRPGSRRVWRWSRDGEGIASIDMACDGASLTLEYRVGEGRETGWTDVTEAIRIERAPCRYGGARPYFRCPGVVNGGRCGRRVGKLFIVSRYALCRHCHRIAYASQSETRLDRLYRKANKARVALGGEPGMASDLCQKPKGMWWRTYARRIDGISQTERRANIEFEAVTGRWLDRMNPTWRERCHGGLHSSPRPYFIRAKHKRRRANGEDQRRWGYRLRG